MEETGKTMLVTGLQYEPTYDEPTKALLQEFETNPAYQIPASNPTYKDGISDGVIGYLGFKSRDDYDQAMAAAAAAQANDTSGFVTGGGSPSANVSTPAATTNKTSVKQPLVIDAGEPVRYDPPAFVNPTMQSFLMPSTNSQPVFDNRVATVGTMGSGLMGAGNSAYSSNLIKALRQASAGQPITQNSGVNFMPNQVTPQSAVNFGTGLPPTGLSNTVVHTTLAEYDPNALYREIYGRDASPSELAATRGKRESEVRDILTNALAQWKASQNGSNQNTDNNYFNISTDGGGA